MPMGDGWKWSGAAAPSGTNMADWRKGQSAAAAAKRRGRWRVGMAWAGFLLVCAGFIWLSTWVRPPRPGRLVVIGAGYETNLLVPDNVAGFGGVKRLASFGDQAPLLKLTPEGLLELRSDVAWEPLLERVDEPMIVVAVSAHGGRDSRGPFLLPTDTDLRDGPRRRLRVEALLDQLAKLPSGQKKLLILDAAFMPSHAALGMLDNGFARGLADLESRVKSIPNLVVLCSTSPDELSWAAPEWKSTAFGHFLALGLLGQADDDGDRRVDAYELWKYSRDNVNRWARINRFAEQTPMLLPSGDEGKRRAEQILVALANPNLETPAPEEAPESPAELTSAWRKWGELKSMTPSPAVFAPHRWQRYQAGVIRVEQLVRQGDMTAAGQMQADLDRWEAELRAAAPLPAPTLSRTWAMALSERDAPVGEALVKQFDNLWASPKDEEVEKLWNGWVQAGMKNAADAPPRRELTRLVLDRLADEPASLPRAGLLLRLIREGNNPYPPEPHFALMFSRDVPANPPEAEFRATLPLALNVRRLAEKTVLSREPGEYAYSERLDPWIGAAWTEVDRTRENGQDLLLGGTAGEWKQAAALIKRAEAGYRDLQADSALIRKAFSVRDRVQSELPFYQMWALRKASPDADLDKTLADAARQVHALDAALARLEPAAPGSLADQAVRLSRLWDDVEARHRIHVRQIRATRTVDVGDARQILRDAEAVLSVPFADRLDVVARQARLSRMILVEGEPLAPPELPATASQTAQQWGRRFGAATLDRLGSAWFDRWTRPGAESFAQVSHRLEIFGAESKWWDSAAAAGDQIGQRIARGNDEIRRLTTIDPKASLGELRLALQDADRIARLADAQTPAAAKSDPATMFRAWLTAELLARQTRRTWQDHWFDDNPAAEPYFRTVCRGHQLDAQKLVAGLGSPPAWKQVLTAWQQTLNEPGELALVDVTGKTVDASGRLTASSDRFAVLTSETALRREYRLQPSRDGDTTPGGMPVVWVEAFQGIVPVEPRERQRVVVPVDSHRVALEESSPLVCTFTSPLIAQSEETNALLPMQRTSLVFKGLFRGQQIRRETRVEIQPTADIIVRQLPMPNKASVAVRTRRDTHTRVASAQGGVAFILDASGSTRPVDESNYEKSRYHQAFLVFKAVLEKLPRDTRVSVWTFGQAIGPEKTLEAEETILQVIPPTPLDPADAKQMGDILNRLSYPSVEPWNESPIARTLLRAKGDLAGFQGVKAIVAITDGHDNRYEKDGELRSRAPNLATLLREEFDKSDIHLNFVLFPPVGPDEQRAAAALKSIETFTPPGKIYALSETDRLIEALGALLKQRLNYYVDYQGNNITVDGTAEKGLDVSPAGQNYRWVGKGMTPGGHKLRVDATGRVEKSILLHPGDLLLADLADSPRGLTFERFLFSSEFPWKRSLENGRRDWKMAILQNQLTPRKSLEMLVTLEKTVDRRETVLEQIRPRDIWIETRPAAVDGPAPPTRWSYLAGYPAPAWAVEAPNWPVSLAPKVEIWWNPDEPARSAADLIVGDVLGDRDRRVFLPQEPPVIVEDVAIEKHFVEIAPGQVAPKNCLVVRIRHASGRPVIARLQGLTPAGSEQRLYTQADKTASLFWFEPDLDVQVVGRELEASRLRLISIAAFKEEARRRAYWLEINDLSPPDPADERPRPPLDLK